VGSANQQKRSKGGKKKKKPMSREKSSLMRVQPGEKKIKVQGGKKRQKKLRKRLLGNAKYDSNHNLDRSFEKKKEAIPQVLKKNRKKRQKTTKE